MKKSKMKKLVSIISAVALMLVSVLTVNVTEAMAAEKVDIHIKNGVGWESINIYNWGDDGEIAGAWPGTAMTDEGNGWFTISLEASGKMNLVFCVDADGDGTAEAQSGDLNDVVATDGEVWISFESGEEGENALGAAVAGNLVLLDGRPDDYVGTDSEEATEEVTEEETKEEAEEETKEATDETDGTETTTEAVAEDNDVPKTSDEISTVILMLMLVSIVAFVVSKKVVVD